MRKVEKMYWFAILLLIYYLMVLVCVRLVLSEDYLKVRMYGLLVV